MMSTRGSDFDAYIARTDESLRLARVARANLRRTIDRYRRELG